MEAMKPFDPEREELYHIAGNVPDPSGGSDRLGAQSSMDMTAGALAHPMIRWRDRVIEGDLYDMGGKLVLHILCPRCSTPEAPHALWVREREKAMEWDPGRGLSVEAFECTWELPGGRKEFGVGMCRWRVAIERNVAREV